MFIFLWQYAVSPMDLRASSEETHECTARELRRRNVAGARWWYGDDVHSAAASRPCLREVDNTINWGDHDAIRRPSEEGTNLSFDRNRYLIEGRKLFLKFRGK